MGILQSSQSEAPIGYGKAFRTFRDETRNFAGKEISPLEFVKLRNLVHGFIALHNTPRLSKAVLVGPDGRSKNPLHKQGYIMDNAGKKRTAMWVLEYDEEGKGINFDFVSIDENGVQAPPDADDTSVARPETISDHTNSPQPKAVLDQPTVAPPDTTSTIKVVPQPDTTLVASKIHAVLEQTSTTSVSRVLEQTLLLRHPGKADLSEVVRLFVNTIHADVQVGMLDELLTRPDLNIPVLKQLFVKAQSPAAAQRILKVIAEKAPSLRQCFGQDRIASEYAAQILGYTIFLQEIGQRSNADILEEAETRYKRSGLERWYMWYAGYALKSILGMEGFVEFMATHPHMFGNKIEEESQLLATVLHDDDVKHIAEAKNLK